MQTRELPPHEWHRLEGTELGPYAIQNPRCVVSALAVEDGDDIVGTWGIVSLAHAEGIWTRPDHRGKAAVSRHLLRAMRAKMRELELSAVLTGAATPEVAALLMHLGARPVDYTPFYWSLQE